MDLPLEWGIKIDGLVRLFDGDLTFDELMRMDMGSQKLMLRARLEQLKRSQEAFSRGVIDSYSRRYAAMGFGGMGGGGGPNTEITSAPSEPENKQPEIKSNNIRAGHERPITAFL